jgi:ribonucleotide reductase alpha subunit
MNKVVNDPESDWITSYTDKKGRKFERKYKVSEIWGLFVKMNHSGAEPALLYWDEILKSPSSFFDEFKPMSTNPCVVGDTMVAVADGRNFVSIEQLAKEGKDVLVHAFDNKKNENVVKIMRNPRITGYNEEIYKITFDDGNSIEVTKNHKLLLSDGSYKRADEMKFGDSVHIMEIVEKSFDEVIVGKKTNRKNHKWIKSFGKLQKQEHRMIWECINGEISKGNVIHHIDGNTLNNNIDNLQEMAHSSHSSHHMTQHNPMHHLKDSKQYSENMSKIMSGEGNPSFGGTTNEQLLQIGINFAKELNRPFNTKEFEKYCEENGIKMDLYNKYRKLRFGSGKQFTEECSLKAGFDNESDIGIEPLAVKQKYKMTEIGYETRYVKNINNGDSVEIKKVCEECDKDFWISSTRREQGVCSISCGNKLRYKQGNWSRSDEHKQKLVEDKEKKMVEQIKAFTYLKLILNRIPTKKEWMKACKEKLIPLRLGKNSPFKSYADLKTCASGFNHRVKSVEVVRKDTVYNGTVDEVHNFYTRLGDESINSVCVNNKQCGEQALEIGGSCNLSAFDLSSFVTNPYTSSARFDFKKFTNMIPVAVRFMDNIIDINKDRHALEIQSEKALRGRRIGLGIMGLADMLTKLNMVYGSEESINFVDIVLKELKRHTIVASVELAKERGMFPALKDLKSKDYMELKRFFDLEYFKSADLPESTWSTMMTFGIRNIGFNTVAPTGSTAMIKDVSSGIEPVFRHKYERLTLGEKYIVEHGTVSEYNKMFGENAHLKNPAFIESKDIHYTGRINVQSAVQKHLSESISSTINLPSDTTLEIVSEIYKMAWNKRLKGVTVYVDKSREGVLNEISNDNKNDNSGNKKENPEKTVDAKLRTIQYGKNKWYVTYTLGENNTPNTLFVMTDAKETTETMIEALEQFGELAVEYGLSEDELYENNRKYRNRSNTIKVVKSIRTLLQLDVPMIKIIETIDNMESINVSSFVFQVKKLLSTFIEGVVEGEKCPECEGELRRDNGCKICPSCGFSLCG